METVFIRVVAVMLLQFGGDDIRFRGLTGTFDKPKVHDRAAKNCHHPKALLCGRCLMSLKQCLHLSSGLPRVFSASVRGKAGIHRVAEMIVVGFRVH